jgi:hypothetical protein
MNHICQNPFCGQPFHKTEGRNRKFCTAACRDEAAEWRRKRGATVIPALLAWDIDALRTKHLELLEEIEDARTAV